MIGFPSLLSLDFESNTLRRYERYHARGVRLTHRAGAHPVTLRDCRLTPEDVSEIRINPPTAWAIEVPDLDFRPTGGDAA